MQTITWVPPSVCGCQIRITGDFDPSQIHNGVSYKHPRPFSIMDLTIISVCMDHEPRMHSMIDTSVFFSPRTDSIVQYLAEQTGQPPAAEWQARGYLKYPIANPTPAECLYTFLSLFSGNSLALPCGCVGHQYGDETNYAEIHKHERRDKVRNIKFVHHHHFTKHCHFHKDDGHDLKIARRHHDEHIAIEEAKANSVKMDADTKLVG